MKQVSPAAAPRATPRWIGLTISVLTALCAVVIGWFWWSMRYDVLAEAPLRLVGGRPFRLVVDSRRCSPFDLRPEHAVMVRMRAFNERGGLIDEISLQVDRASDAQVVASGTTDSGARIVFYGGRCLDLVIPR